jgi:hypothetical protein
VTVTEGKGDEDSLRMPHMCGDVLPAPEKRLIGSLATTGN